MSAHRLRVRQMTGDETRGNAQPDFAALNPGLAGAPLLQQQQQADRDTCKDHPQSKATARHIKASVIATMVWPTSPESGLKQPRRACFFG